MEDGEKPTGNSHDISDMDVVEAACIANVHVQAIGGLPDFCKDTPENIGKMVDILVQILGSEEFVERDAVHKALISSLRQDVKDTWKKDVKPRDIEDAINQAAVGKLRVVSVSEVSRVFHPNFSAKWRRYLYIFPLTDGYRDQGNDNGESCDISRYNEIHDSSSKDEIENQEKSYVFSVSKVNRLLQKLEGKLLSYKMFARDTKASRNDGPPTECFVYHARAMEVKLPTADCGEETKAMCVELVANRFLRKMVRVLVATSIREAAAGAEDDALIKLMDATCRRATAPPAPPDGLCLVDVGYTEFDPQKCFILIE